MAWRDSRQHRGRLLLFISSIIAGVAALVAINAFGDNLRRTIDDQAKTILGADMVIRSRAAFSPRVNAVIDSLGGQQARDVSFASMGFFPRANGTRLVSVRALGGDFPFYGEIVTEPAHGVADFRAGKGALLDAGLMIQYGLETGDTVKIGTAAFPIAGRLQQVPGQASAGALIAPRVYIPLDDLDDTGLVQFGSRVNYQVFFKFSDDRNINALTEQLDDLLVAERVSINSAQQRSSNLGGTLNNLSNFLSLVAFIALLLGCIGVASAIHVHIKQKLPSVAILRCVGARIEQTFSIYMVQAICLGVFGALLGAILGIAIQLLLPVVFAEFLIVEVDFAVSWSALIQGIVAGVGMTLLFALLPLMAVRRVSPLAALRSSFDSNSSGRDWSRIALYGAIFAFVVVFAILQADSMLQGAIFVAGLTAAFAIFVAVAHLLMTLLRRFFPSALPYPYRQSLANLYRPQNQTLVLMLAIGLGTFLIATLLLTQQSLLYQISSIDNDNQPNMMLFDIQVDQVEQVEELVKEQGLPVIQQVPIITLRLESLKGRPVSEIKKDSTSRSAGWALNREYRVTYRDTLSDTEEIVAGEWAGVNPAGNDTAMISFSEDVAGDLDLAVGDHLDLNVQGIVIPAKIASLRKVNWQRVQPNFLILFPRGVLEEAPQIYVLVTRVNGAEASGTLQREIVRAFPNVSAIDLDLILKTAESILSRVAFVIRFMALFSIITGLIVLVAAVITTRMQRIRESVLLRTLGAKRRQITLILALEYGYLGALAALTGILLAVANSWALAEFLFKINFVPPYDLLLAILLAVVALTVLVGMLNSRGIATRPPLEILRSEA